MEPSLLVPPAISNDSDLRALADLLRGRRAVALAGAGMSTESGIPDYRGPETARRARNPMQARQFLAEPTARARYWARSMLGWPRIDAARPNDAHRALAALERSSALTGVITQNVDGLHQAAGSLRVVELHGALARVRCLDCGAHEPRKALQERLLAENPGWDAQAAPLAPDGDADLEAALCTFRVPPCLACGGVLKPDVVFFGENVPRHVVDAAWSLFDEADALLVVGSSLTVYSGFRFVRRAAERGIPVAIVNIGPTRGDEHAAVRVDARLGDLLPRLATALGLP
ncbi:NAD-dependent protein deacetylase [Polyangium aurulentum]|uniref:NAD-dependent protein deacetylase n=1 Tax=Polyangium aurulentum TaxID=2567896 RepID=UPI00146C6B09|nr:NAD-dependent protein deacetylase [Polyangium aurulentum]UQA55260.1 NAD-dependent protein deacetylase [Polyangium aurulentum]